MSHCQVVPIMHEPAIYRKLKVFLCHSSGDKTKIRELCKRLYDEDIEPWFDEEKLLPGQDWDYEISKAVRESDAVIVCVSSNSISKAGYVNREIAKALEIAEQQPQGSIYLVPIRLDDCEIPDRLSRWHYVNYFDDKGYEKLIRALRKRADDLGLNEAQFPLLPCSPWSKYAGSEQASKFTPKSYPAKIMRIRFYITSNGKPDTPFEVNFYDDRYADKPGELLIQDKIIAAAKSGHEWVDIDVSNFEITINEGDFYVSMYWMIPPGKKGQDAQFLGAKAYGMHKLNRTFKKFGASDEWSSDNGKQWMIQAILSNGDVLDNTVTEKSTT